MYRTKKTVISTIMAISTTLALLGANPAQAASEKPSFPPTPPVNGKLNPDRNATPNVSTPPGAAKAIVKIQNRVASYVAKHGTSLTFISYVDSSTGKIVLSSNAPTSVLSALTDMTGAGTDEKQAVQKMLVKRVTTRDVWSRRSDIQPYYGGGGITAGGSICSSGYTVKNSAGTKFMVTAGHCFSSGASVSTESGGNAYGTVSNRHLPTVSGDARDMELIGGKSYTGRIFTGGTSSSTSIPVVSAGEAVVGYTNYCHSGRTTGENCSHKATSIAAQVCTSSGCKSPVIAFTGGTQPQGGDSGSPFYAKDNSGAWIRGHVIAGDGTTSYAEKWTNVASTLGVSIVTG
jgi:hypothetical protein